MCRGAAGSENYYLYNLTDGIVDSANAARLTAKRGEGLLLTVDPGEVRTINRIDLYPAGVGPLCGAFSPTDVSEWTCHHTYITDGDSTKAWASELFRNENPDVPEWITIDLLEVYDVDRVVLIPRGMWQGTNVFPEKYEIRVSVDGEKFTTVKAVEDTLGITSVENRVIEFEAISARYIRLYTTWLSYSGTVNGGYAIEMSEMEVYGREHDPEA